MRYSTLLLRLNVILILVMMVTSTSADADICETTSTCTCIQQKQLVELSTNILVQRLQDRVISARMFIKEQIMTIKEFLSNVVRSTQDELNTMFEMTYGNFYLDNSKIFIDFFDKLNSFAVSSSANGFEMSTIIDEFFENLFQTLFILSNPFHRVNDNTWKCMKANMEDVAPFGEHSSKARHQLELPLTKWKLFIDELETLHSIFDSYLNINVSSSCSRNLSRMRACPLCNDVYEKPCSNYCTNVLNGCTYQLFENDELWRNVIDTLIKTTSYLNRWQNIVTSIKPLPYIISEAIMHFQEHQDQITNKMIASCMYQSIYTKLGRTLSKRSSPFSKPIKSGNKLIYKDQLIANQIFDVFSSKLKTYKDLLKSIPIDLCGEWSDTGSCWNGTTVGDYQYDVISNEHILRNPEFRGSNIISFRGIYIEERLRLSWLQSRLVKMTKSKVIEEQSNYEAQPFVQYDDDDYDDSIVFEASGKEFKSNDVIIEPPNSLSTTYQIFNCFLWMLFLFCCCLS